MRRPIAIAIVVLVALGWFVFQTTEAPPETAIPDTPPGAQANAVQPPSVVEAASGEDAAQPAAERTLDGVTITFPNGNTHSIALRPRPKDSRQYGLLRATDDSRAKEYERLKTLALEGDGNAAYALYQLLKDCELAYLDPQDLESAINRMYETRVPPMGPKFAQTNVTFADDDFPLLEWEQSMRTRSESCRTLSAQQLGETRHWLKIGADLAHDGALMDYVNTVVYGVAESPGRPRFPHEAIELLERSWLRGNVHALHELYQAYRYGSERVPADRVKAHAYLYLNTHLRLQQIENRKNMPAEFKEKLIEGRSEYLRQQLLSLSPFEVAEATELAEKILLDNAGCCYEYF